MQKYWVYIVCNKYMSALYTGVTNDIVRRIWEHKAGDIKGFTQRYKCTNLLYFEEYADIHQAIAREKQIKGWRRERKIELIVSLNPTREDLATEWYSENL